jgi:hypothetical protein
MRVKGGDDGGTASRLRLRNGFTCDRLMPQMKAVKIAQSDDSAAQGIRHAVFGGKAGDHHINITVALSRQCDSTGESRRAVLRKWPPFDGRNRCATAAQGYG